jgi:hypothetical protein
MSARFILLFLLALDRRQIKGGDRCLAVTDYATMRGRVK